MGWAREGGGERENQNGMNAMNGRRCRGVKPYVADNTGNALASSKQQQKPHSPEGEESPYCWVSSWRMAMG